MHEQSHSERRKMRHREVDQPSKAPLVHRLLSPCKGTVKGPDEPKPRQHPSVFRAVWEGQGLLEQAPTASALLGTSNHTDRILL